MRIRALLDIRRRRPEGEDGVALLMSLALIGIFSTLMLTMLALVVSQVKPTAQARKDLGSVNAAGSGLQAGLAAIRHAVDLNGEGTRGGLPCTGVAAATFKTGTTSSTASGASLSGAASTLPGSFQYHVDIAYYQLDPTDKQPQWLHDNALTCPLSETPLFAFLQSYGTGDNIAGAGGSTGRRGNRAQAGVYQFSVPAANVAGGRLVEYGQNLCVDAGGTPAVGSTLFFRTCLPAGSARQLWQYRQDLTLFYGGNPALNLCIQGSSGTAATLQRCTGTGDGATYKAGSERYEPGQQVQLWSFNDNGHFATAKDNGDVTSTCLQPAAAGAGAQLTVYGCTGDTTEFHAFNPDPAVGAGKAGGNTTGMPGSPTNQYVNFAQFGRCLDVTSQQVNADHLIAYPCKQAPDSTRLTWNQVWTWTGSPAGGGIGTLRTTIPSGAMYCLSAPDTGNRITTKLCVDGQANQQWVATGQVGGSPETSYNLVSQSRPQQCMSVSLTDVSSFGSSTVVLEPCDGSTRQRWNAPPPLPPAGLNSVREASTAP